MTDRIFTFGANLAGKHGKGAALYARQHHGAVYGQGIGRQGNSYAIPTKDERLRPLPLTEIQRYVNDFIAYAVAQSDLQFQITAIGTGLCGYSHEQIAPMFASVPANCFLCEEWKALLENERSLDT